LSQINTEISVLKNRSGSRDPGFQDPGFESPNSNIQQSQVFEIFVHLEKISTKSKNPIYLRNNPIFLTFPQKKCEKNPIFFPIFFPILFHSLLNNLTPVSDKLIMTIFSHLNFTILPGVDTRNCWLRKIPEIPLLLLKFLEIPEN
jgi:hypothetical protein